jgi:hypothetical protein
MDFVKFFHNDLAISSWCNENDYFYVKNWIWSSSLHQWPVMWKYSYCAFVNQYHSKLWQHFQMCRCKNSLQTLACWDSLGNIFYPQNYHIVLLWTSIIPSCDNIFKWADVTITVKFPCRHWHAGTSLGNFFYPQMISKFNELNYFYTFWLLCLNEMKCPALNPLSDFRKWEFFHMIEME